MSFVGTISGPDWVLGVNEFGEVESIESDEEAVFTPDLGYARHFEGVFHFDWGRVAANAGSVVGSLPALRLSVNGDLVPWTLVAIDYPGVAPGGYIAPRFDAIATSVDSAHEDYLVWTGFDGSEGIEFELTDSTEASRAANLQWVLGAAIGVLASISVRGGFLVHEARSERKAA